MKKLENHKRKGVILEMLKYAKPELIRIDMNATEGRPDCANGPVVSDTCTGGSVVTGGCSEGTTQIVECGGGGTF